jgi:hypothetical protein
MPDLQTWPDGYVDLIHTHLAELMVSIEEFINDSASHAGT